MDLQDLQVIPASLEILEIKALKVALDSQDLQVSQDHLVKKEVPGLLEITVYLVKRGL